MKKVESKYGVMIAEPVSKFFYSRGSISHAGSEETSIMLFLYPYMVKRSYKSLR